MRHSSATLVSHETEHGICDASQKAQEEERSVSFHGMTPLSQLRVTLRTLATAEPSVDAAIALLAAAVEQVVVISRGII